MFKSFAAAAALALAATTASAAEFVTVVETIEVARPAPAVWALVGGFCDIGKVRSFPCVYTSGTGGLGTVRRLNTIIEEVKVGEGLYSYGYLTVVGNTAPVRAHGNMSVLPSADGKSSKIVYTMIYDQASLSQAERAVQKERFANTWKTSLATMKKMAEAGK